MSLLAVRRLVYPLLAACLVSCTHAAAPDSPPAPDPGAAPDASAPTTDFNTLGSADAPVMMLEFSDLQCPYCAQFALYTFPRLKQAYIDTGRVRYVSHELPLSIHPQAIPAALAARCAGEQDRYWEYRHAVFDAQARLSAEIWDDLARQLGLNVDRFAECRRDGRQFQAVHADAQLAASYGLASTPSFVIGRPSNGRVVGRTIGGAQPFDTYAAKIDAFLAEQK